MLEGVKKEGASFVTSFASSVSVNVLLELNPDLAFSWLVPHIDMLQ